MFCLLLGFSCGFRKILRKKKWQNGTESWLRSPQVEKPCFSSRFKQIPLWVQIRRGKSYYVYQGDFLQGYEWISRGKNSSLEQDVQNRSNKLLKKWKKIRQKKLQGDFHYKLKIFRTRSSIEPELIWFSWYSLKQIMIWFTIWSKELYESKRLDGPRLFLVSLAHWI